MIRPGLCSVTFRALSPQEVLDLAAQAGVEAIEWGGDKHVPPDAIKAARDIGAQSRARGIQPSSYGAYVRAGTPDALQAFAPVLETAVALGAGNIRVWAGAANRRVAGAAAFHAAGDDLHEMARMAAAQNITVSVEYHRNTLTEEAEDTRALFERAAHDNLFSYWQPVPGRGKARWLEEIAMLAPFLGDLHVFHWIMTKTGQDRRPLAEGAADWRALFATWTPTPRWPHPRTGFLEFVRADAEIQFHDDMQQLLALCRAPDNAT